MVAVDASVTSWRREGRLCGGRGEKDRDLGLVILVVTVGGCVYVCVLFYCACIIIVCIMNYYPMTGTAFLQCPANVMEMTCLFVWELFLFIGGREEETGCHLPSVSSSWKPLGGGGQGAGGLRYSLYTHSLPLKLKNVCCTAAPAHATCMCCSHTLHLHACTLFLCLVSCCHICSSLQTAPGFHRHACCMRPLPAHTHTAPYNLISIHLHYHHHPTSSSPPSHDEK